MTALRAAGITDPGQVRGQNQDTFIIRDDLVLIADGMGGYAGGEVAAEIAADVVANRFSTDATARGLAEAFHDANRRIFERGAEPGLEGMGTTLVAAAVVAGAGTERLLVANVGDSRGYLLRDGSLRQLTEDHSVAAELVRMGRIEEEEGVEHPGRHVLTRALGVEQEVAPDVVELEPQRGDRLLLCSDGLSNELDQGELLSLLSVGEPSDAARALVAAANAHGGLDNITAVVADVLTDAPAAGAHGVEAPREWATSPDPIEPVPPASGGRGGVESSTQSDAGGGGVAMLTSVATSVVPAVAAPPRAPAPAGIAVRPVLTRREQRRRRREEYRARRSVNKWVSLRGAVFVLALGGVLVGSFFVLRWYGTSNYIVGIDGRHLVIEQGQPGGFLWWKQKVVRRYPYGPGQVLPVARASMRAGVDEPSLSAALHYVANMHAQWKATRGNVATGSTTTTTTYAQFSPQG